jgi:hypothetical protein
MAKPDILLVDGHAFSWHRLSELRQRQLEAWDYIRPFVHSGIPSYRVTSGKEPCKRA